MSISKLLMTAAVCVMSMAAVSTSYGSSSESLAAESGDNRVLPMTASVRRLVEHDGSGATELHLLSRRGLAVESDRMSLRSTASTISHDRLAEGLKKISELLKRIPREVTLPKGVEITSGASKPTQLDVIYTACFNLVDAYNGLLKISTETTHAAANTKASFVRILARAKGTAEVEKGKIAELVTVEAMEDQIVFAMDQREKALMDAETRLVKAEKSVTRWKAGTMVTSAVLTVVTGILLNIIRNQGLSIIFGGK